MDETEKYIKNLKDARPQGTPWKPTAPEGIHLVINPREKWEAEPPIEEKIKFNKLPVTCVYFTYLSGLYPKGWDDMSSSKQSIKQMQSYYMSKGLPDIPYSFFITADTRIYEGRGWKFKPHVKVKPHSLIDIAFAQTSLDPKKDRTQVFEMLETGMKLVHFGIQEKYVSSGYITLKRHVDEAAVYE